MKTKEAKLLTTTYHKKRYLEYYAKFGLVYTCAKLAGISPKTIQLWRVKDVSFAELEAAAKLQYIEKMEEEADRRGMSGVEKPVYQGGRRVGVVKEFSDTLLIFRLKAMDPKKYRERLEMTGEGGGPIKTETNAININGADIAAAILELARVGAADSIIKDNAQVEPVHPAQAISETTGIPAT
jgi:hypothetical protein